MTQKAGGSVGVLQGRTVFVPWAPNTYSAVRADSGVTVALEVRHANRLWLRLRGLMGERSLPPGAGLLIDPCNGVHGLFMRFAIDAVYLDRDGVVVKILSPLRPWRVGPVLRRVRYVLELPAGACEGTIRVGDRLAFRPQWQDPGRGPLGAAGAQSRSGGRQKPAVRS